MAENLKEERMQILKMVQSEKISIEEGVNLLEALEEKTSENFVQNPSPKWIKIRVYDPDDDTKVNVNLPISFVGLGLKIAKKFSPELKDTGLDDIDFKDIFDAIKNGAEGKIVDLENEDGEKVEITVE